MPNTKVTIGGRSFEIACEPGQEEPLQQAADLLNTEADTLQASIGRVPEPRMLLMAGLMLADRTIEIASRVEAAEAEVEQLKAQLQAALSDAAKGAQAEAADQVSARDMAAALDVIKTATHRAEALAGE